MSVFFKREVLGDVARCVFLRHLDCFHLARSWFHRYDHAWLYFERAAVNFLAVDVNMAVGNELLRSKNRSSHAKAEDDVVKATLELLHEELGGVSFAQQGFAVGIDELLLAQHAIDSLELLSLIELDAIL